MHFFKWKFSALLNHGFFILASDFFATPFQNDLGSNGIVVKRWCKLGLLMVILVTWVEIRGETQACTGNTSCIFFDTADRKRQGKEILVLPFYTAMSNDY